ncbi:MAG TPA: DUF2934 domain-containing protein [Vicinamibacterales bacterium]|jgi:hypothetical protein|nr:DUF2934 domain-containing protein [Vicinamibacterales bacterium]
MIAPEMDALAAPVPADRGEATYDEIAAEAYSLFEGRGGQHGDDVGDWLAAEQMVKARREGRTER